MNLATKPSDSGGTLAQAKAVSCVEQIVLRLSELFVVIDRQVLNPVASPRTDHNLGQVNFSGASFELAETSSIVEG